VDFPGRDGDQGAGRGAERPQRVADRAGAAHGAPIMIVALPVGHPLSLVKPVLSLHDLLGETLIIFPKAPRPSYADQVLAAFHDRALQPGRIHEARELQIALGLVAAGEGISIVPSSVHGLKRDDISYKELDDPNLVSPIIMSTRSLDETEEISAMLDMIYRLYEEERLDFLPPG